MPSSRRCWSSTGVGAPVSGSAPDWVFGKAITSRMLSSPARMPDQPVDPEREPGVRRRAVAERVEQEAEPGLRGLGVDPDEVEDPGLEVALVDPDAPRPQLPAVAHEVVRLRADGEQVLARARCRAAPRSSGWGAVNGWCAGIGRPSSAMSSNSGKSTTQQKWSPPSWTGGRPRSLRIVPSTESTMRRAPATTSRRSPASAPVASTSPSCSASLMNFTVGDSSAPPSRTLHPHQPGRAELLGPVDERVEPAPAEVGLAGPADALHRVGLEGPELGRREHVVQVDELEPEAEVGLVGAEPGHRGRVGEHGDVADRLAGDPLRRGRDRLRR